MNKQVYILGPCALENEAMYFYIGLQIKYYMNKHLPDSEWYYKASFDKANRTSISSMRGVGLDKGIEIFSKFKKDYPEVKLITDVHETHQVKKLKGVVDVVQIPAFLCRQTDLVIEAAKNFDTINIKKGQWLHASAMKNVVKKVKDVNPNAKVWITERGSTFGYDYTVVDFNGISDLKNTGADKIIFDVTHSTQRRKETTTGGDSELAKKYFVSSGIFNFDGIFAEVHSDPENAISDKESQINIRDLEEILKKNININNIVN